MSSFRELLKAQVAKSKQTMQKFQQQQQQSSQSRKSKSKSMKSKSKSQPQSPKKPNKRKRSHNSSSHPPPENHNNSKPKKMKKPKHPLPPASTAKSKNKSKNKNKSQQPSLQDQMRAKLQGAQFRWLNEKLYTCTGKEAFEMFQNDPTQFHLYHQGFRSQAVKWPVNPNDLFIAFLKANPSYVVGDFGCGEAQIAASVPNKVHSFDLVAQNDSVTECDIANVPLQDASLDVAIFSLALMGTNYVDFIKEAVRTLKVGGWLKIAEVQSRFEGEEHLHSFINAVCALGCKFKRKKNIHSFFTMFDFQKVHPKPQQQPQPQTTINKNLKSKNKKQKQKKKQRQTQRPAHDDSEPVVAPPLKPCRYKKR